MRRGWSQLNRVTQNLTNAQLNQLSLISPFLCGKINSIIISVVYLLPVVLLCNEGGVFVYRRTQRLGSLVSEIVPSRKPRHRLEGQQDRSLE